MGYNYYKYSKHIYIFNSSSIEHRYLQKKYENETSQTNNVQCRCHHLFFFFSLGTKSSGYSYWQVAGWESEQTSQLVVVVFPKESTEKVK